MRARRFRPVAALVASVIAVSLSTIAVSAGGMPPGPFVRVATGERLPDYAFESLSAGGRSEPRAFVDLRGQPVVVVLWATWCGVCAGELPKLARLHAVDRRFRPGRGPVDR